MQCGFLAMSLHSAAWSKDKENTIGSSLQCHRLTHVIGVCTKFFFYFSLFYGKIAISLASNWPYDTSYQSGNRDNKKCTRNKKRRWWRKKNSSFARKNNGCILEFYLIELLTLCSHPLSEILTCAWCSLGATEKIKRMENCKRNHLPYVFVIILMSNIVGCHSILFDCAHSAQRSMTDT